MENEEIKFIQFNKALEIEKYYGDDCSNTYTFIENDIKLNVKFNFNLSLDANIIVGHVVGLCINVQDVQAENIMARNIIADNINVSNEVYITDRIVASDINAKNIFAWEIVADNINADDISYYSYCISKYSLKCKSIKGRDKTAFLKCIVGEIKIKEND